MAIHDSEYTRLLDTTNSPATAPTPSGPGTSGLQWWPTNWHYFTIPESLQEALVSDGTLNCVVTDAQISTGVLLTNGLPAFPIVFSLASEAIDNSEIAALTNYVAAGGFLFVGSSSFTRNTNGTTRGDCAIGSQLGLHMVVPGLTNWVLNNYLTRQASHLLVNDLPSGQLTWNMAAAADEIPWGVSPAHPFLNAHFLWRVQPADATVLATAQNSNPYISIKNYGKGWFIYYAAQQPLIGHNGFAPSMYAYTIFRRAIEWAFDAHKLPVPKLSPWPFAYDAAFIARHDLENFTNEIANVEASAAFEKTNRASGEYYFCTGTVRDDAYPVYDTNAIIAGLRRAVTNSAALVGPHNGGLKNPNNPALARGSYDYWHWGPDEALDVTPTNYASGQAYASASLSNSFNDVEGWLAGITNGIRAWTGCYFNATREASYQIQEQLGIRIAGDERISPFPHWTLSSQTSRKHYPFLSVPTSDWFVGGLVAQSLEPWHPPGVHTTATLRDAIDYYYRLGGLINFYSHGLSTGVGDAGPLIPESITYALNTNLHPRVWSTNSLGLLGWWLERSNVQVSASLSTNGAQSSLAARISGAHSADTAVEFLLPSSGTAYAIQIRTNGTLAAGNCYRTNLPLVKIHVGTAVTNAQIDYLLGPRAVDDSFTVGVMTILNIGTPGVLGNDFAGNSTNLSVSLSSAPTNGTLSLDSHGGFTYTPTNSSASADQFTYQVTDEVGSSSSATARITLSPLTSLFSDDFVRPTEPGALSPWVVQSGNWKINTGTMIGGSNAPGSYGFCYVTNSWSQYAVQARFQFPTGGVGGGLGACVDPISGKHYAAWLYPEGSPGGPRTLKLIKFTGWGVFGYNGQSAVAMAQTNLASVGTNFHTLKLASKGNRIAVAFDGAQMLSVTDVEATPYLSGGVSLDLGTDTIPYAFKVDDVLVTSVVQSDGYATAEDTPLVVAAPGVLTNDTPVFTSALNASVISSPGHGSLSFNTNGGFTYTPATNYNGSDSFTYQTTDGTNILGTASVSLSVAAVNDAPVLPAQSNRTILLNSMLVVTNAATDVESPPQTLGYVLANPPVGALIDTNGLISWTPDWQSPPGDYTLTTIVTDNGTPPLSATNSFVVSLVTTLPPAFRSVSFSSNTFALSWTSVSNQTYRLQYKNDLNDTNWTAISPDIEASDLITSFTNSVGNAPQRFYRLLVVP